MRTSDRGIIALMSHEGIVPAPYFDSVGVLTYGVGHTAAAGKPYPRDMLKGMPANLDAELVRVFDVFRKDLEAYEGAVARAIKVPVEQHEFDAAVSFHFNTGAIHRASWVASLNRGDRKAAAGQIMNWRKPAAIIPRREDEQALFRDGVYPDAAINVWNVSTTGKVIWRAVRRLSPSEALSLLRGSQAPDAPPADEVPSQGLWAALVAALLGLFKRKK